MASVSTATRSRHRAPSVGAVAAAAALAIALARLHALTADNPRQRALLAEVERDASSRLSVLGQVIDARSQQGMEAAVEIIRTNAEKHAMDALRRELSQMDTEEARLLVIRE